MGKPLGRPLVCLLASLYLPLLLTTLLVAPPSSAQINSDDPWAGVEEMPVSGVRAYGLTTDSPVSVTSFNADDLLDKGIVDVPSLAQFTPNLEIKTAGATSPIFFIRGVGLNDFTANATGAVAVYIDDVPLSLSAFQAQPIFDTQDVQVLKGPQGSGFGRNASAGAIKVYSKKPTGDFNGYLRTDYGNFNALEVEGAVGMPIVPDILAARISFNFARRDGTFTNRCGNLPAFNSADANDPINLRRVVDPTTANQRQCGEPTNSEENTPFAVNNPNPGGPAVFNISSIPAGLDRDLNDVFRWALRGQLRFTPTSSQDWTLNLHGLRIDQLGAVGQPLGTAGNTLGASVGNSYQNPDVQRELESLRAPREQALLDQGFRLTPTIFCTRDDECREARDAAFAEADEVLARRLATRPLDTRPFDGDINLPGHERIEVFGASLRGEIEFENFLVTSITGAEQYRRSQIRDFDFTSATIFEFFVDDKAWQLTEDLLIEGELDITPLTWKIGVSGIIERLDFEQNTGAGGDIISLFQSYRQQSYGISAFAEMEWEFADDFELIAGIRANWERKDFEIGEITANGLNRCDPDPVPLGGLPDCRITRTYSEPTGTVALKYTISEEAAAYWKYSRGFKANQFNISDGQTRDPFTLAVPETVDAFEVGFNASWLDGIVSTTGAFFWYRYENYQVFLFSNDFSSPPQRIVQNANAAQLYGAELDLEIHPVEGLELKMAFGWLESRFLDFADSGIRRIVLGVESDPPVIITEVPIDFTGNRLPNTPRFTVTGHIKYTLDMGSAGTLTPRWDYSFTDDNFFDPSNGQGAPNNGGELFLPRFAIGQKGYLIQDMRLTYKTLDESIQISGWVRNLTNEVYKSISFDASATAGLVGNFLGDPRTYGLSAKVTF